MADDLVSIPFPAGVSTPQFGAYGPAVGPQVTHAAGHASIQPDLAKFSQSVATAVEADWSSKVPGHALYGTRPVPKSTANNNFWFSDAAVTSTEPILEKKIWSPVFSEFEKHKRWGETYKGRLAMRSVSRFFIGTAFFAAGTVYGYNKIPGYNNYEAPKNILQHVARFVDNTAGKAIETVAYGITHDKNKAQKAIMFRDSVDRGFLDYNANPIKGHSLGYEAVRVTFNFASMSFGDYMARYFISLFDKNASTGWVKDGRLNFPGGMKELGHAIFKGITYGSGEDIFAAVPYVYYLRAQSKLMDKVDPGFQKVFDRSMMGSGVKLNDEGQAIGGDKLEGVIGFTAGFTVYNILTKFYRDLYATIQERFSDLRHGRPHKKIADPEHHGPIAAVKRAVMYFLVTTSKMTFIAMPSAFVFSLLRVPQIKGAGRIYLDAQGELSEFTTRSPHMAGHERPWFVSSANLVRDTADGLGNFYSRALRKASERTGIRYARTDMFAHEWADAAVAYTPYFMMKSDLMSPFLDTARTNFVLSGFYASLWATAKAFLSFNSQEVGIATQETKKWWNEVTLAMHKQPSPNFEPEIQRRMENTSYKASLEAFDMYQGSSGYQITENSPVPITDEIGTARDENSVAYAQRYPSREKITASSKPGSYTERVKPKGAITQKSLLDRVIESASENNAGITNK